MRAHLHLHAGASVANGSVGNDVITFFQSLGPHGVELIGVNVEKQEFVYYAGLSCL